MFRNYLKTTIRSILRNKTHNFLNIFGLATGIACAALIFLWVKDEVNYDSFHAKRDKLYITKTNSKFDSYTATFTSTPGVMGPALKQEIPGIANTCRATEDQTSLLFNIGDNALYAYGQYVDPSFFNMFSFSFVQGSANSAFAELHSIVITEKAAKKFFGTIAGAVGKSVRVDNKQDYIVKGVIKDLPQNSTIDFEWLMPFEVFYQEAPWAQKWENSCVTTYVELNDAKNLAAVNAQMKGYIKKKVPGSNNAHFLFAMKNWRLYNNFDNGVQKGGRIEYVRLFSVIAWVILLIACINFMNLATARSEKRAREVGVRKVLGAGKKRIAIQFMGEAMFMALLGGIVAVVLIQLCLPAFNLLVQKQLNAGITDPLHIAVLLGIVLICGLIAGSYPSLYLSSFNPVYVLKGIKLKSGGASMIRKGLVITQFSVSIILIISTVIIFQQIQHVKSRNLGFNVNNLVEMKLQGNMLNGFPSIKQDLLNSGMIQNVSLTDHETIYSGNNTTSITWQGKDPKSQILISQRLVSPEFISTSGMQLTEGRDFVPTDEVEFAQGFQPKDPKQIFNVIITESMAKILGSGSAIGKIMQLPVGNDLTFPLKVTGVVKDYVYGYMYGSPDPVIFYCLPKFTTLMYARIKPNVGTEAALSKIESILKQHNPGYPFQYKFVDDQFNGMFMDEMLISKLSKVFASLAILISCLGLFGLAAYTAERRTKEIGIRKVLGASVTRITSLLSADFLKLVAIASLVAFPIAFLVMKNWLQEFPYRIEISAWVFVAAGLTACIIALLTISFQSIKAAVANPVKSLRTE